MKNALIETIIVLFCGKHLPVTLSRRPRVDDRTPGRLTWLGRGGIPAGKSPRTVVLVIDPWV